MQGIKPLKKEISRFVQNFIGINVSEESCIPTVGNMQGTCSAFITIGNSYPDRDTVLFIDPGFFLHKVQVSMLKQKIEQFDVYNYRGDKLTDKLESYLATGKIHSILYSNPNNPTWICFTDKELRIIGELAKKYDVIVLEDLAYFGMDFRVDISKPGVPPYQRSAANYCDNYILFISSSKIFSYAGQRCAMMVISDNLYNREYMELKKYYSSSQFGHCMVFFTLYALTAGTSHSAQCALTAILSACNNGEYNFVEVTREYGERAKIMKKMFTDNGFKIVYDMDEDVPIADGFYFTVSYPGMTSEQLLEALFYYGISAISLEITGSERKEGIRVCVSLVLREQLPVLKERLMQFNNDFNNNF